MISVFLLFTILTRSNNGFPGFSTGAKKNITMKTMQHIISSIPNLVGQIHKRGREYENSISIEYLSRLNERYEAWISTYDKGKLIIIDVDNINFVDNPEDLGNIINRIDAEINGLF